MLLAIVWFLFSLFLFVRYIRAGKTFLFFLFACFFLSWSFWESKLLLFRIVISVIAIDMIVMAILKERRNPLVVRLQKGYTIKESIVHYALFGVVLFMAIIIYIYAR